MNLFPYGTNAGRERSGESLYAKLGVWATFAVLGWCVLIGSYYFVNWIGGGLR